MSELMKIKETICGHYDYLIICHFVSLIVSMKCMDIFSKCLAYYATFRRFHKVNYVLNFFSDLQVLLYLINAFCHYSFGI